MEKQIKNFLDGAAIGVVIASFIVSIFVLLPQIISEFKDVFMSFFK